MQAESYSVKSGLDFSGRGGSGSSSHMPVHESTIWAQREIKQARGWLSPPVLGAFDAVMREGESFSEAARRMCAHRYVRVSVRRQREILSAQFVQAACELALSYEIYRVPQSDGRIRVS